MEVPPKPSRISAKRRGHPPHAARINTPRFLGPDAGACFIQRRRVRTPPFTFRAQLYVCSSGQMYRHLHLGLGQGSYYVLRNAPPARRPCDIAVCARATHLTSAPSFGLGWGRTGCHGMANWPCASRPPTFHVGAPALGMISKTRALFVYLAGF